MTKTSEDVASDCQHPACFSFVFLQVYLHNCVNLCESSVSCLHLMAMQDDGSVSLHLLLVPRRTKKKTMQRRPFLLHESDDVSHYCFHRRDLILAYN